MTKRIEKLSREDARKIILQAQLLYKYKPARNVTEAAAGTIGHLGYIQIDTIAVVERAHQHIFWSRDERFTPKILDTLQRGGRVFEYWTHAMSYVPMEDYRYYLPRMRNFLNAKNPWFVNRYEKSKQLADSVLARIRAEGALGARDFENNRDVKSTGWWDWKPAKDALEFLFWQGKLMIAARDKFQKIYDLPERVLPEGTDTSHPGEEETALFIARRALRSLGLFTRKDASKYLHPEGARDSDMRACSPKAMEEAYNKLIEMKEAVLVSVEGDDSGSYLLNPALLAKTGRNHISEEIHLLSPFDNLVIKRERLSRMFDFDYTIECYVPAPKRQFGYFVLPVIYGSNFTGRMDVKAERKTKTLLVQNFVVEKNADTGNGMIEKLAGKINSFARFNGCEKVTIIKNNDKVLVRHLQSLLLK